MSTEKKFASQADLEEKKVSFVKLSEHAYAYTAEGDPNTGIIIGDDAVLVADTQATPAMAADVIRRIREVTDKPIKYVVLTHYHAVRVLGASAYQAQQIIASQDTYDLIVERGEADKASEIGRFPRLFSNVETVPAGMTWPTLTFTGKMTLWLGKLEVQLLQLGRGHTKGDTVVWLPQDRIVFTGNMTGPLFGHVPNLYTVRGERYRYVQWYIDSVQRVLDLGPELLITGHGEPVRGAGVIRAKLTGMRDATQYLRDQTFAGMNAGKGLWELMDTIKLPADLAIPQGPGKVPWIVRASWEEHLGWFRYESSTELYNVPPQAVFPDLIELAGGIAPVLDRAQAHLAAGRPLQALHLAEAVLAQVADNRIALRIKLSANEAVLEREGRENFSEVRWLESEIRNTTAALETEQ